MRSGRLQTLGPFRNHLDLLRRSWRCHATCDAVTGILPSRNAEGWVYKKDPALKGSTSVDNSTNARPDGDIEDDG
jgi:hypothetical protein